MNKELSPAQIPDGNYEGYIWMSDGKTAITDPEEIKRLLKISTDSSNPFIIEGQLYNGKNISYSIKHANGKHKVVEYKIDELPSEWRFDVEKDLKTYIANRIIGVKRLKFRQYWIVLEEEKKTLCPNIPVLVPGPLIFVGFEY